MDCPPRTPPASLLDRLPEGPVWWIGESLVLTLAGRDAPTTGFTLAVAAPASELRARLPEAVVTGPDARRLSVPTRRGPVDLLPRVDGRAAAQGAPFPVLGIAWEPRRRRWHDPHRGRCDLAASRLRSVGPPDELLRERPELGPRAVRLGATLGLAPDAGLEEALRQMRVDGLSSRALGRDLRPVLLAPDAGPSLRGLARYGWLGPTPDGLPDDLDALLDALPADLELRLAAWLRRGPVGSTLRRLAVPVASGQRVRRLLEHHPIDRSVDPANAARVAQMRRRLGPELLQQALRLREAEIRVGDASGRRGLEALRTTLAAVERREQRERVQRSLAVDGALVMDWLALSPGPAVGRVLQRLAEHVLEHPEDNTRARLRDRLESWGEVADR